MKTFFAWILSQIEISEDKEHIFIFDKKFKMQFHLKAEKTWTLDVGNANLDFGTFFLCSSDKELELKNKIAELFCSDCDEDRKALQEHFLEFKGGCSAFDFMKKEIDNEDI